MFTLPSFNTGVEAASKFNPPSPDTAQFTPPPVESAGGFTPPPVDSEEKFTPPPTSSSDNKIGWLQDTTARLVGGALIGIVKGEAGLLDMVGDSDTAKRFRVGAQAYQQRMETGVPSDTEFLANQDQLIDSNPSKSGTVPARIATTVGQVAPLLAAGAATGGIGSAAFGVGSLGATASSIGGGAMFAGAGAFSDAKQQALNDGKSEEESNIEGLKQFGKSGAEMAAFMGVGKVIGALAEPFLPVGAVTRGVTSGAVSAAGNMGVSAAIRSNDGQSSAPTLESTTQDVLFGALHGFGESSKPEQVVKAVKQKTQIEQSFDALSKGVLDGTVNPEEHQQAMDTLIPVWKGVNSFLDSNKATLEKIENQQPERLVSEEVGPATQEEVSHTHNNELTQVANEQEQSQSITLGGDQIQVPHADIPEEDLTDAQYGEKARAKNNNRNSIQTDKYSGWLKDAGISTEITTADLEQAGIDPQEVVSIHLDSPGGDWKNGRPEIRVGIHNNRGSINYEQVTIRNGETLGQAFARTAKESQGKLKRPNEQEQAQPEQARKGEGATASQGLEAAPEANQPPVQNELGTSGITNEQTTPSTGTVEGNAAAQESPLERSARNIRESAGVDQAASSGQPTEPVESGTRGFTREREYDGLDPDKVAKLDAESDAITQNLPEIPYDRFANDEPINSGSWENAVYHEGDRVYKVTKNTYYGLRPEIDKKGTSQEHVVPRPATPSEYLERLDLQNKVFGDDNRVEGWTKDKDGHPRLVISQRFLEPEAPVRPIQYGEISDLMTKEGFLPVPPKDPEDFTLTKKMWYRPSDGVIAIDANPNNFIRTKRGIDPVDIQMSQIDPSEFSKLGWPMPEQPVIQGLGNATEREFEIQRVTNGADIFNGLKEANGSDPTFEQWSRNFQRQYEDQDFDEATLRRFYDKSKTASDAFGELNGAKPMPEVVRQQEEGLALGQTIDYGVSNQARAEQMRERGLSPAEEASKKEWGVTWDNAIRDMEEHPDKAYNLITELDNKMRPVTDEEQAILQKTWIDINEQSKKIQKAIADAHDSGDQAAVVQNRIEMAGLSDQLSKIDKIQRETGTAIARSLAFRKAMIKEDFSLSNMLSRARAAKDGEALTEKETAAVEMQHSEIEKALADIQKKIDKEQALIAKGGKEVEEGRSKPWSKEISDAMAELKKLREERKVLEGKKPKNPEESAQLRAYKTRTINRIKELETKIKNSDYAKKARNVLKLDQEAIDLQVKARRLQDAFNRQVNEVDMKNRTGFEKLQDEFVKYRRGFILSSPVVFAKLASAAAQILTFTPIQEGIGSAIGKIPSISQIAAKAAREGGFNAKAEARASKSAFTQGIKDAWQSAKTGKSDLDVLYGKDHGIDSSWIEFFGKLHGAMKAPVVRAEFERSFEKRTQWAIDNGIDVSDPLVKARIASDAYQDGLASKFQNKNAFTSAYKAALGALSRPNKETGRIPAAQKVAVTAANALLPIIKIPTNIAFRTAEYLFGTLTGSAKAGLAFRRGIETLTPNEADAIMSNFKKGSIGAGLLLTGFLLPNIFGGYYTYREKRKPGSVKAGEAEVNGSKVPKYLMHTPMFEAVNFGATMRHVMDGTMGAKKSGISGGALAAMLGLTESIPFINEMLEFSKVYHGEAEQAGASYLRSFFIPQLAEFAAKQMDKDAQGNVIPRKPKGEGVELLKQEMEMGIPGLRQNVPANKK